MGLGQETSIRDDRRPSNIAFLYYRVTPSVRHRAIEVNYYYTNNGPLISALTERTCFTLLYIVQLFLT